jgi:hypothetical protein
MSVRNTFPQQRPTLNLDFANSKTLDPRITFSRTTTATYVDEDGLIKIAAADESRFDHDPVTGECLGLLIEEQGVNYETNTEDPTQWTTPNMIPTGNSVILPTGQVSTTVEYRGETTDPNNKFIRPQPSGSGITAGDTWVYSGFYKKGVTNGERYIHIVLQNNTASESTGRRFDFDTGTWASSQSLNNVTVADSGYQKYPNDWYRIWMSCTFPSASGAVQTFTRLFTNSTSIPYDTSFSLWGAQLEKASFMTSYIPNNTGSQITRTADNVSMVGENFSSWYNPSEGTIFSTFKCDNWNSSNEFGKVFTINQAIFAVEDNGFWIGNDANASNTVRYRVRSGGENQFGPANLTRTSTTVKSAMSVKSSDFAITIDGNTPTTSISGTLPQVMNSLTIGRDIFGIEDKFLNGTISKLTYYPTRLSNDQLQNLTK